MRPTLGRLWLIIPPIVVGALVLGFMVRKRADPTPSPMSPEVRTLRVIEVSEVALVPRVVGYGTAQFGQPSRR